VGDGFGIIRGIRWPNGRGRARRLGGQLGVRLGLVARGGEGGGWRELGAVELELELELVRVLDLLLV
jgi:hypothetical protein